MQKSWKTTSRLVSAHLPCPSCGSSDALSLYDDGHSYCFSCSKYFPVDKEENLGYDTVYRGEKNSLTDGIPLVYTNSIVKDKSKGIVNSNSIGIEKEYIPKVIPKVDDYTLEFVKLRGVSRETFAKYSVKARISSEGLPVALQFPYSDSAYKVKSLVAKEFWAEGPLREATSLFGQEVFGPASNLAITITEGELDAVSAYQMLGSKYPVVSVRSAQSARKDCEASFQYLNSFEKIYVCFDNDRAGKEAEKSLRGLFDGNKVYHVELNPELKDANGYLTSGREKEFVNAWWNAKNYLPEGVINSFSDIEKILNSKDNESIAQYPFPTLNEMTYGIRSKELVLFTAQEKVGKTEVMRAIEHHLLKTTDYNIGIIHLEEQEKRSVQGLVSYELGVATHLPDAGIPTVDQLEAYKRLVKVDGRLHFYKHFGSDDADNILDVIRYLVGVQHCKFVFLDHITMLVTGQETDDERQKLDYISTRLAMMTRELDFTLFLVSHVNDNGQTRGSRNISKVADLILHMDRDIEADSFDIRNQTKLICRGNRFASSSGPSGILWFDAKSYTVKELEAQDIGGIAAYEPF